jgi:hypothetical protein
MTTAINPSDAARELFMFISNDAATWRAVEHLARNYERKRAKGAYDTALACKGMAYPVESAAKAYARAHCDAGTPWHAVFPPADRHDAAAMLVEHLEGEWQAGNSWAA